MISSLLLEAKLLVQVLFLNLKFFIFIAVFSRIILRVENCKCSDVVPWK